MKNEVGKYLTKSTCEIPRPHAESLDENRPECGGQPHNIMVIIKRVKLAGVRAQKWIATDPRNERAHNPYVAHIWVFHTLGKVRNTFSCRTSARVPIT